MDPQSLILGASVLFVLVFVSGFSLTRKGKPYSPGVLTGHKVISIAGALLVVLLVINGQPFDSVVWVGLSAAALFFFVDVATGAMLTADQEPLPAVSMMHKLAPWFTIGAVFAVAYLLVF